MKRILLPTDFSENARNAIDYSIQLFGTEETKFCLLHTYQEPASTDSSFIGSLIEKMKEEAEKDLKKEEHFLKTKYKSKNIKIESVTIYGDIITSVNEYSKAGKFDLVVMGTKGATGLKEVFIGSNAADVMMGTDKPLLLVPEDAGYSKLKNVLFATDHKDFEHTSMLYPLVSLLKQEGAGLMLLNVMPEGESTSELASIKKLKAKLKGIKYAEHFIEYPYASEGLEKYIAEHDVDLVAMVNRKRNLLQRIFHKSVSKQLALHTHVPLLVMHE